MKRFKGLALLLLASVSFGTTTYTTRTGIPRPADGDSDWGTTIRAAFDVIDSSVCLLSDDNAFSGSNSFSDNVLIKGGEAVWFYSVDNGGIATISNPSTSGQNILISAPSGACINGSACLSNIDLAISASSGGYGRFAVIGSSADASTAYSGFKSTSPILQSTLWSLPRADGTSGQALITDGSAHLSFSNWTSTMPATYLAAVTFSSTVVFNSTVTATFVSVSTITPLHIVGTVTNDSATVGTYGEYISSFTIKTAGTTAVYTDVSTITLTAGDWDISINAWFDPLLSTTATDFEIGISTIAGNSGINFQIGDNASANILVASTLQRTAINVPVFRQSLSSTKSVYVKTLAQYTGTAPSWRSRISARRVR